MSIMTDNTTIVFGTSCDTMKIVHEFLKKHGLSNVNWEESKFDEITGLCLLMLQNELHLLDFVAGGGFNADDKKYRVGSQVIIRKEAYYYSSKDSKEPSGIVFVPTTGILNDIGENVLNPLLVTLMDSPLKQLADYSLATISNEQVKTASEILSFQKDQTDKLMSETSSDYDKSMGGFIGGSVVYLRKDDVIPSYSDMVLSDNLSKIMVAGNIVSKGIQFINDQTDLGTKAKQFQTDDSKEMKEFLMKDPPLKEKFKREDDDYERLLRNITEQNKKDIKSMMFNENGMFIKNLITDTIIYIPFRPDGVDESYSVSWQEQNTRGSSHNVYGYEMTTGSSPSISFDIDVGAISYYLTKARNSSEKEVDTKEPVKLDEHLLRSSSIKKPETTALTDASDQIIEIVSSYLNAIKALAYPSYDNGIVTPPSCYISIANNFRFVGVCTNVNISHKGPMYIKRSIESENDTIYHKKLGDQIYMNYSITLNFNKIVNQDFSADTVEMYGDNWTGGMDSQPYRQM